MKRSILTLVLAAVASIVATAATATMFDIAGMHYYVLDDGTVSVSQARNEYGDRLNPDPFVGELSIPSSVTYDGVSYTVSTIGYEGFSDCDKLTAVSIPNSIKKIDSGAFVGCNALAAVKITDLASWCSIQFATENLNYPQPYSNPLYLAHRLFVNGVEVTDLEIPASVTSIGASSFNGMSGLKSLTIGSSVTQIGDGAFNNCPALSRVQWNVKQFAGPFDIDRHTPIFGHKSKITEFVFGDGVEIIPNNICYRMTGLKSVVIPNSAKRIGVGSFCGCSGLESVTIGNQVKTIGEDAFNGCTGLKSVEIPNSVTEIYDTAFGNCTGLTQVSLPESIKRLHAAFSGCGALKTVSCLVNHPGNMITSVNAFDKEPLAEATLRVPRGTADSYRALKPWSLFGTIADVLEPVADPDEDPSPGPDGPVSIAVSLIRLDPDATYRLFAYPEGIKVTWSSSDTNIVTVDEYGNIAAVGPGLAEVTATAKIDGSTASCPVFVGIDKHGDMNYDGKIDVGDVNTILNMILGDEPQPDAQ